MPYNIDGTMSPHAKKVKYFSKKLEKILPNIPVILVDERLSTAEAKMKKAEYNASFDIDAESARIILEYFLEAEKLKK